MAGAGVGGLPAYVANGLIESGALIHVLKGFSPRSLEIHALYPSKKFVSARVRVCLDALRTVQLDSSDQQPTPNVCL